MQINRIQSYGSSWVNNRTGVNNHQTQTNPNFGIKVKVPELNIPDNIKTLDALKDYLNGKNMLGLLSVVAATLGIKEAAVSSEPQQVKTKKIIPPTPEQQKQFEAFFDDLKIKYEKNQKTGLYIIDKFKIDNNDLLNKHGIDLDTLFKYVQEIKGDADFKNTPITSLGNLEKIGEYAYFNDSQITDLGNLEKIGGSAYFSNSKITDLSNLKEIGGEADFENSKITDLGNLQEIGGNAIFRNSPITSLGNLQEIGGDAIFRNSPITSLGNLEKIGGNAYFRHSQITSLKHLKRIDGCAWFNASKLTSLGDLEYVGNGYFCDSAYIRYQIIKKGLKDVPRSNCD